ncbi:hypothetical protein GCM10020295_08540 [Streptomyces cinereospinus]
MADRAAGGPSGPGGPPGPGGPGGGGPGGPDRPKRRPGRGGQGPWWRSVPRVAAVTVLVAAVTLAVVLTRLAGGPAESGEVILQPTNATGPDPWTPSTARTTAPLPAAAPDQPAAEANAIRSVAGSEPGLYGGSHHTASCDVEKQIRYLTADRTKNEAFASVLSVPESAVPGYLRSLTSVLLRSDTRVSNHGYHDGAATKFQSVLQAGTAVLVDGYGEPKVRCACGNPLTRAIAQKGTPQHKGDTWSGYRPQNVVVINRAAAEIKEFVIFDAKEKDWIRRHSGDQGDDDEKTAPPPRHWPLPSAEPPGSEPRDGKREPDDGKREGEPRPEPKPEPKPDREGPEPKPDQPGKPEPKPDHDQPEPKPEPPARSPRTQAGQARPP